MTSLSFSKYSGCGNDFILLDNRKGQVSKNLANLVTVLCHRNQGIGADGVILWEDSLLCDYKMRIFNADGSEAEMCGNGLRCFGQFLKEKKVKPGKITVEVMQTPYILEVKGRKVNASMPSPKDVKWDLTVETDGRSIQVDFLDTGVPHVVVFVDNVDAVDFESEAFAIRHHPLFAPKGTNVDYVELCYDNTLKIRTFERGVEGETLACGTGVVSEA